MVSIKHHFASRQEIAYVFAACAFPIHVWVIINLLKIIPAWVLRLNFWDLAGVISYTLAFAFLESLLILLPFIVLGAILPERFFRVKFVALSATIVFVTSTWFIVAHYQDEIIRTWGAKQFLIWMGLYIISIGVPYGLILRHKRVEELIVSFVERLTSLSFLYVSFDIIALIFVIIRNI